MHTPVKTRTPVNKIHVPLWAVIAVPVAALVVGAIIGAAATALVASAYSVAATPKAVASTASAAAPAADPGYSTAADLQAAFVAAGGVCDSLQAIDSTFGGQEAQCTDGTATLAVFGDTASTDTAASALRQGGGGPVLEGSDWLIADSSFELTAVQKVMGGTIQ